MNIRVTSRLAIFVALLLISVTGFLLVLQATPEGAGLSDDSIAYIAGARSMLAGDGYREAWLESNQPVTHFPPAFPSVLAFFGFLGMEPLHTVRWVNAFLFFLTAGLLGILAWRMTPSLTAGLVIAGLFVLCGDLLQVHAMALSEPLFIFISLLSFWMFDLYFERRQGMWLIACATLTGIAYLTRYSGLALAATFIVALLILHRKWKQRFVSIAVYLAALLPWMLGWTFRNRMVAGNATNRVLAWHPLTQENLRVGLRTVADALFPIPAWREAAMKQPIIVETLIILILGAVLAWLAVRTWKIISAPQQASAGTGAAKSPGEVVSFTTGLYIFAYLASIVASMLMFDAATKFKLRIMAPVFVSLLILLIYFGVWLRNKNRQIIVVMTFVFLAFSAYKQVNTINFLSKGGVGYASFQWYDSKAMEYLRELPDDLSIYTNEPAAVYLYTGRGARVLPTHVDSATALQRDDFDEGVSQMKQEVLDGKAVLVIFDGGEVNAEDGALFGDGLYLAHKSSGDVIYTAQP